MENNLSTSSFNSPANHLRSSLVFLGAFLILLFVADRIIGFSLDHLYRQLKVGTMVSGKLNRVVISDEPYDLFILGSSRADHHVIPDSLLPFNAFNLGIGGAGIAYTECVASILNQYGKKPEVLLLHLDEKDFLVDPKHEERFGGVSTLGYYYGKNEVTTGYLKSATDYPRLKYAFKTFRYNGRFIDLLKDYYVSTSKNTQHYDGFDPIAPTSMDSVKTLFSANTDRKIDSTKVISATAITALDNLIAASKTNGTALVCFSAPVFEGRINDYYKGDYGPVKAQLHQKLKEAGVPYLDYSGSQLPGDLASPSLWKDATHLNVSGARRFSSRLRKDLFVVLNNQ